MALFYSEIGPSFPSRTYLIHDPLPLSSESLFSFGAVAPLIYMIAALISRQHYQSARSGTLLAVPSPLLPPAARRHAAPIRGFLYF